MNLKQFFKKYNHALVFLYGFIYIPWFLYLEKHVTSDYHIIESKLDSYIPFVEYFIVPYLLWFALIAIGGMYLFFADKHVFLQTSAFLIAGMTLFLIICTIFPNGQNLRPETFARDNIFVDMVRCVYATDTPTNVLPSIHVFNSLGIAIGFAHAKTLRNRPAVRYSVYCLAVLIILSTVFLKQHSVIDMIAAFVMAGVLYQLIYVKQEKRVRKLASQPVL